MPINELINLRELFHKDNMVELKKLEMLTKSVLFSFSAITKKASIKLIREKYKSIKKIFTGDNQIMAEIYFYDGGNLDIKNRYICDVPKKYSGIYKEVQIIPFIN